MSRKSKLFCFRTLDPHAEIRLIKGLLDPQIGRSCDIFQLCIALVSFQVVSHNLHIDGSGQTKIKDLADHVGRQKSEGYARELLWKRQAKLMNVVVRGVVLGGKGHKNVGVRCADWRRIAIGEVDAAVGQTDVVNDVVDSLAGICCRIDCST